MFLLKLSFTALWSLALAAHAAQLTDVPERAIDEIQRRGNSVEYVDGTRSNGEVVFTALAPPQDDSHKWFITVVTQQGCQPCARLKYDFANSRPLQAFVDVTDHRQSWAHYNVYQIEDQTQAWRWKQINLSGFPTLLVQPPRSGDYGPPATVVLQLTGYDGQPRALAEKIRDGIVAYAQHVQRRSDPSTHNAGLAPSGSIGQEDPAGRTPAAPFRPPSPDPLVPQIDWPRPDPTPAPGGPLDLIRPETPKLDIGTLLSLLLTSLFGGSSLTTLAVLGGLGFMGVRWWRKSQGKRMIISDELLERVAGVFFNVLDNDDDDEPKEQAEQTTRAVRAAARRRRRTAKK